MNALPRYIKTTMYTEGILSQYGVLSHIVDLSEPFRELSAFPQNREKDKRWRARHTNSHEVKSLTLTFDQVRLDLPPRVEKR